MTTKRKLTEVAAPRSKEVKQAGTSRIDESRTAVTAADTLPQKSAKSSGAIEISSDSESEYDDLSEADEKDDATGSRASVDSPRTNSHEVDDESDQPNGKRNHSATPLDEDAEMMDDAAADEADEEIGAAPTFGDLVLNREPVEVPSGRATQQSSVNAGTTISRQHSVPSISSLGTVLSQALRTDDTDLLESCLQITDAVVIRNTIQRLDSSLAGILLTKLATRLHRRPGRAHVLMTYIQWTLVAHGGALATQPEILKRLVDLNKVLDERTRGLNSLLLLKGRLDMLEAQLVLRRANRINGAVKGGNALDSDGVDAYNEQGVVYVEGEEDEPTAKRQSTARRDRDSDDDDADMANGVELDSDDDSEDDDDLDQDEVDEDDEELDQASLDDDDVELDEGDVSGDEESEEETLPPAKAQKTTKPRR